MKRIFLVPFILLGFIVSCGSKTKPINSNKTNDIDYSNTYVMVVGVLKWENGLSPFSDVNRKDKELYDLFIKLGVPKENMVIMLDEEATLENIKKEFESLLSKVPETGTFIFYYAGHGMKKKDGSTFFANYDINTNQPGTTGLAVEYIGDIIREKFKGKMVWLTADCCYSGSLMEEGKKMKNINTLVSTSATASNSSTENWTFTQTMIDCLSGLSLADHDKNGTITAGEWQRELEQAMKYREKQRNGFALFRVDSTYVIGKADGKAEEGDDVYPVGTYAQAFYEKVWQPVRIIGMSNGNYKCEFYHYSDKEEVMISADQLKHPHFVVFPEKSKVKVLWEGEYYVAEILKSEEGFHYITYPGYGSYWDEWVMYDRIKTGNEKPAEVKWEGAWYPAMVLEEKDGKYFIHYTDDSYVWDEWVGNDRIRFGKYNLN